MQVLTSFVSTPQGIHAKHKAQLDTYAEQLANAAVRWSAARSTNDFGEYVHTLEYKSSWTADRAYLARVKMQVGQLTRSEEHQ